MADQKVLVKKTFYNALLQGRLEKLLTKKKKENKTPKGVCDSNCSATLLFFQTSNVKEAVCEASLLIISQAERKSGVTSLPWAAESLPKSLVLLMFAVSRNSEKPGKEKREQKGDFQVVLEKVSFSTFIYLSHLFEGDDCGCFCCSCALPSNTTAKEGEPVLSPRKCETVKISSHNEQELKQIKPDLNYYLITWQPTLLAWFVKIVYQHNASLRICDSEKIVFAILGIRNLHYE